MDSAAQDRRPTVLIVEDDEAIRRLLALSLRVAGFDTVEAGDGLSAIALLERSPVDVVVLDLMLPGFDGFVVRDEIAAQPMTRHIPVIIVTGSEKPVTAVSPNGVLRKPVTPEQVVATVKRCLGEASRAAR